MNYPARIEKRRHVALFRNAKYVHFGTKRCSTIGANYFGELLKQRVNIQETLIETAYFERVRSHFVIKRKVVQKPRREYLRIFVRILIAHQAETAKQLFFNHIHYVVAIVFAQHPSWHVTRVEILDFGLQAS